MVVQQADEGEVYFYVSHVVLIFDCGHAYFEVYLLSKAGEILDAHKFGACLLKVQALTSRAIFTMKGLLARERLVALQKASFIQVRHNQHGLLIR